MTTQQPISLQSVSEELKTIHTNGDVICSICSEILSPDDTIKLQCNHEYHYECIRTWYRKTIDNNHGAASSKNRECPYCRKHGGYLPLKSSYEKDIHSPKMARRSKKKNTKYSPCKATTKMGLQCKHQGNYDGYCYVHKKQNGHD